MINESTHIYLIGIGGIGMSALALYFRASGKVVAGYDRSFSAVTDRLIGVGVDVTTDADVSALPAFIRSTTKEQVLVVYTPAVPKDHPQLVWFEKEGYTVAKRAKVLGEITRDKRCVAVAGTHGKTTTTTLAAHLLNQGDEKCSAFMGGVSVNYNSNLLLNPDSSRIVVEADEYDRSFLQLFPDIAIVTSMDADHLDIYGSAEEVIKSYVEFINHVGKDGTIILKEGLEAPVVNGTIFRYGSLPESDYRYENAAVKDGMFVFDLITPAFKLEGVKFQVPGRHNIENATAAAAAASLTGISADRIRAGLETFKGVQRRFQFHVRSASHVYIDDYGHHPAEIKACLQGVRELFPDKKLTLVFQPHLYSRTRDFAADFGEALKCADQVYLLPIYAARELPIEGVTSELLTGYAGDHAIVLDRNELLNQLKESKPELLVSMGAGDIDQLVTDFKNLMQS